jgi:hypothetical protein
VLNIPQKKGKPPDDADQEYSILGKCLESDPWETEPEYKEQVAVVHFAALLDVAPRVFALVPTGLYFCGTGIWRSMWHKHPCRKTILDQVASNKS